MWTKEKFIEIADQEIEKIKSRNGRTYSQYSLWFGKSYHDSLKFIVSYYEDRGYVVITHICKRRFIDISIQWNQN